MTSIKHKKVELLRALNQLTDNISDAIDNIDELGNFGDQDYKFMRQFKSIYMNGTKKLVEFIEDIEENGNRVDVYTIEYYIDHLYGGPLRALALEYSKDESGILRKNFKKTPDILGIMVNNIRSSMSTPIFIKQVQPLNIPVDTYNKLPQFAQEAIIEGTSEVNKVFYDNFNSGVYIDNTLPEMDKKPEIRTQNEYGTGHNKEPHANYMVKDNELYYTLLATTDPIVAKIKEYLDDVDGEYDFRILSLKKQYNPFDQDKNIAKGENTIIKRNLTYLKTSYDEDNNEIVEEKNITFETDIVGNQFESDERRSFELEIENEVKNKKYKLNTIRGQLGSGDEVKEDPITD